MSQKIGETRKIEKFVHHSISVESNLVATGCITNSAALLLSWIKKHIFSLWSQTGELSHNRI